MKRLNPESTYYLDESLTMDDIREAYKYNESLTGRVTHIDTNNKTVLVSLNDKITAKMLWDDVTIKKLTPKYEETTQIPPQISSLYQKKIRVKVKGVMKNAIYVSRKANMLEAWNILKKLPKEYVFKAAYTGADKNGTSIFYDIAEGLIAFCHVVQCTSVFVEDMDKWLTYGTLHDVVLLDSCKDDNYLLYCSRKKACKTCMEDLSVNQIVNVKVAQKTKNMKGYHVEVTPLVAGIADLPYDKRNIEYGQIVQACVKKIKLNSSKKKITLEIL